MEPKKVELEFSELKPSSTQTGAYMLLLKERRGKRMLPVIIGALEAQAIAVHMEKMELPRPLTHDSFLTSLNAFDIRIVDVLIYNLREGIFYARLLLDNGTITQEIDLRSSDAASLALRANCPIFVYESILAQAGIVREEENGDIVPASDEHTSEQVTEPASGLKGKDYSELENMLTRAIEDEDYELASKIRDEMNRRT